MDTRNGRESTATETAMDDLSGLAAREQGHAERWVRKRAVEGDTVRLAIPNYQGGSNGTGTPRKAVSVEDDGFVFTDNNMAIGPRDYEVLEVSRPDATQDQIAATCDAVKAMLLAKNRRYGNSALEPVRIFSRATPVEQILVRLDDKLSRLRSAQTDEDEDVVDDLIGYLVLLKIARAK